MSLIKTILNFKDRVDANPFSIIHTRFLNPKVEISDFFPFRLDEYETIFIAENNLALLTSKVMICQHIFHFFDSNGKLCNIYQVKSEEFHYKLSINIGITGGAKFGSFTHHTQYSNNLIKQNKDLLNDISFQHRGYSGFRKNLKSGFSYVHGNFGGMYVDKRKNIQSLARLRGKHTYTPQFIISPNYSYEFVFSNPVNKKACIKFFLINGDSSRKLKEVCVDPFGTFKLTLREFDIKKDCNIAWETKLPIGRCVVFKFKNKYFDVFHS